MIGFSGVWDAQMKHRLLGFIGFMTLVLAGYYAITSGGLHVYFRLFL